MFSKKYNFGDKSREFHNFGDTASYKVVFLQLGDVKIIKLYFSNFSPKAHFSQLVDVVAADPPPQWESLGQVSKNSLPF